MRFACGKPRTKPATSLSSVDGLITQIFVGYLVEIESVHGRVKLCEEAHKLVWLNE